MVDGNDVDPCAARGSVYALLHELRGYALGIPKSRSVAEAAAVSEQMVRRMDSVLDDFRGVDGCSTGDCPHGNVNECVQAQAEHMSVDCDRIRALEILIRDLIPDDYDPTADWWCPNCRAHVVAENDESCSSCGTPLTDVQPSREWLDRVRVLVPGGPSP